MAKQHGARQQKRLAKQKAKRSQKKWQLDRVTSNNPMISLRGAADWPIMASLAPEGLWDLGLGQLVLARRAPLGRIACAVFLVDVNCLGVKNAFARSMSNAEYDNVLAKIAQHGRLRDVTPEHLAKIVRGAVDYAHGLGFSPHHDYRAASLLLEGIDATLCPDEFEFGKDGKPFYVRGPNESLARARQICDRVRDQGGHFMVGIGGETPLVQLLDGGDLADDDFDDSDEFDGGEGEAPALPPPYPR